MNAPNKRTQATSHARMRRRIGVPQDSPSDQLRDFMVAIVRGEPGQEVLLPNQLELPCQPLLMSLPEKMRSALITACMLLVGAYALPQ